MANILDILIEFLKEVEKNNPYKLVLKGGTALSIYYLNRHRESEDLYFDANFNLINSHNEIKDYFIGILNLLKSKNVLKSYSVTKSEFSSKNRYHINLILETHKKFQTKIDVDFVNFHKTPNNKNKLLLYSNELLFVNKSLAFIGRKEFKDLHDISYLIKIIDISKIEKKEEVANLISQVIDCINEEDIKKIYKSVFRNIDMKFKDLNESNLETFMNKTIKSLRILINNLKK